MNGPTQEVKRGNLEYKDGGGDLSTLVVLQKTQAYQPSTYLLNVYKNNGSSPLECIRLSQSTVTGIEMGRHFPNGDTTKYHYLAIILATKMHLFQTIVPANCQTSEIKEWNKTLRECLDIDSHKVYLSIGNPASPSLPQVEVMVHLFPNSIGVTKIEPTKHYRKWNKEDIQHSTFRHDPDRLVLDISRHKKSRENCIFRPIKDNLKVLKVIKNKLEELKCRNLELINSRPPMSPPGFNRTTQEPIHHSMNEIQSMSQAMAKAPPPIPPKSPRPKPRIPVVHKTGKVKEQYEDVVLPDTPSVVHMEGATNASMPTCSNPNALADNRSNTGGAAVRRSPVAVRDEAKLTTPTAHVKKKLPELPKLCVVMPDIDPCQNDLSCMTVTKQVSPQTAEVAGLHQHRWLSPANKEMPAPRSADASGRPVPELFPKRTHASGSGAQDSTEAEKAKLKPAPHKKPLGRSVSDSAAVNVVIKAPLPQVMTTSDTTESLDEPDDSNESDYEWLQPVHNEDTVFPDADSGEGSQEEEEEEKNDPSEPEYANANEDGIRREMAPTPTNLYVNTPQSETRYVNPPLVHPGIPVCTIPPPPVAPRLPNRDYKEKVPPRQSDSVAQTITRMLEHKKETLPEDKLKLSINIRREVTVRLDSDTIDGRDWHFLADKLGLTYNDTVLIDSATRRYHLQPTEIIFCHWHLMKGPPVECSKQALRNILIEMGREDVLSEMDKRDVSNCNGPL